MMIQCRSGINPTQGSGDNKLRYIDSAADRRSRLQTLNIVHLCHLH